MQLSDLTAEAYLKMSPRRRQFVGALTLAARHNLSVTLDELGYTRAGFYRAVKELDLTLGLTSAGRVVFYEPEDLDSPTEYVYTETEIEAFAAVVHNLKEKSASDILEDLLNAAPAEPPPVVEPEPEPLPPPVVEDPRDAEAATRVRGCHYELTPPGIVRMWTDQWRNFTGEWYHEADRQKAAQLWIQYQVDAELLIALAKQRQGTNTLRWIEEIMRRAFRAAMEGRVGHNTLWPFREGYENCTLAKFVRFYSQLSAQPRIRLKNGEHIPYE